MKERGRREGKGRRGERYSSVGYLPAELERCRRSGRPGVWTVGAPATGRVGGPAANTGGQYGYITSR